MSLHVNHLVRDNFTLQVTALILIPLTWQLGTLVAVLILGGFVFFYILSKAGERLIIKTIQNEDQASSSRSNSTCKLSTSSSTNIMMNYESNIISNNNNNSSNSNSCKEEKSPTHAYTNSIDIKD